jgi:hypothetical protein
VSSGERSPPASTSSPYADRNIQQSNSETTIVVTVQNQELPKRLVKFAANSKEEQTEQPAPPVPVLPAKSEQPVEEEEEFILEVLEIEFDV